MKKSIIIVMLAGLITACSSTPTPINEAKNVPQERIFEAEELNNEDKFATLKVLRDSASDDVFMSIDILINGKRGATLLSKEMYTVKLNPKDYVIEARIQTLLDRISPVQVETIFREGKTYFYRVGYNAAARSVIFTRDFKHSD